MDAVWLVVGVERGKKATARAVSVAAPSETEALKKALKQWAAQGVKVKRVATLNLARVHESVEALLSEPPMIA